MARSDLLLNLVRAGAKGDQMLFRRTVEALVAEERAKQHHVLADRLGECLVNSQPSDRPSSAVAIVDDRLRSLISEITPKKSFDDLILPAVVSQACSELVEEQLRRELLQSYGLEPRHRVLLIGPPGNGKTSVAEAFAEALSVPLLVVRYDGIIGSYLGETAVRLRRVFDFARSRACVLFFDEFDTLGKERGDIHDTGEIKRVVSSLLLQIDDLPSYVVTVSATNHPELLDRAVWRRFQLRITLLRPSHEQIEAWLRRFEERAGEPLGSSFDVIAKAVQDLSFAEIEEFGADVLRRRVLAMPGGRLSQIISERLEQWQMRTRSTSVEGANNHVRKR